MADLVANRYRLIRKIGIGGMGEVYSAHDERLERDVAVKKLTFFSGTEEQLKTFTARFKREAISMAQFVHPYIVPVYDFGEEDGRLFLVMGLMSGGSLKEKMGQPMPVRDAVEILLPVVSALSYVHENGVIHRDVKPANILFNQRGTPMLADFGIVKLMESEGLTLTAAGTGVGTPAYMAPEQVTNDLDHRIDQYSLGVIFYELLTGKKPYTGDTPVMTLIKHRTEPLPDPRQFVPELSEEVVAVINKVLAKDRDERYVDMDEFEVALRDLFAEESTRSLPHVKDVIEDIAQELAEEAAEEAVEKAAEKAKDRFDEVDAAAETQLSEAPAAIEEYAEEATRLDSMPVIEEVEPSPHAPSQPVVEAFDDGATQLNSKLVSEEIESSVDDFDDEGATQVASQEVLDSGATEIPPTTGKSNLIGMIDGASAYVHTQEDTDGPTEILDDDVSGDMAVDEATELLDDGATELLDMETAPAPVDFAAEKPKSFVKKIPVWVYPVALVVIAGLIVGLLALLGVGPFTPKATPKPTYSAYTFENEEEEPQNEPEPEDEEPAVVEPQPEPAPGDNEISICIWGTALPLMEHMSDVFQQQNPDVVIRLDVLDDQCMEEALVENYDFALQEMTPEERLLNPDGMEFHIGYTPLLLNLHREIGIEMLSSDDLVGIFTGAIRNWSTLGGPNAEVIVVAEEWSFPWVYAHFGMMNGDTPWREDMVYLGSLDEVNAFVDENWNAIALTGAYGEPEHIIPVGVDGVEVTYETLAQGEYPLMWPNVLTTTKSWDQMSEGEQRWIEFLYSDEGWDNIWTPKFVPWYKDFSQSNSDGEGVRIAGSSVLEGLTYELANRYREENPEWSVTYEVIGGGPAIEALGVDEVDIAATVFASFEEQPTFVNKREFLVGWMSAFFFTHKDLDIWSMGWEQIRMVLTGEITNWSELGGPDQEIVIAAAEHTFEFIVVRWEMLDGNLPEGNVIWFDNSDQVVDFIVNTPNAIGIVYNYYPSPDEIHWMRIGDIDTSWETIQSGEYPLEWAISFYTNDEPSDAEWAFIDFIFTEAGKQVFRDYRLVPIE